MNNLIVYFFQSTLLFIALFLIYKLVLSQLTFHRLNRFILLSLIPISVFIPLMDNVFPPIHSTIIEVPQLFETITLNPDNISNGIEKPMTDTPYTYFSFLMALYCIGILICLLKFFFTTRKLIILKRTSKVYQKEGFKLIATNVPEIFSYFNWIFTPEEKLEKYDDLIIEHEKAHIQLKHSVDLIIAEFFITFFWFNPTVYLYRKSLKSIHEFQADHQVLKNKVKTSHYMQLLLQSIAVEKPNNLYSYFNHPILLKRINMMTKTKSNNIAKLKYLLLLPVCALFLIAFTKPTVDHTFMDTTTEVFEIENFPPSLFPVQNGSINDISSKYGSNSRRPKISKKKIHRGIDIRAEEGTPVIATADGIISKASMEGDWGNLIVISHSGGYETWYAHLKSFNSKETQHIKKGEIIGYVGNTGLSTGPHLHYEVKLNGNWLNPIDYIKN
ncbi:M23/M56 family metallopeptidase [Aquimarina algiphila]|uniref:M23/M56 family metallopeptidase n=1 Tax=Aquimarina algiphila TaxID=2047982 RepID=UPI00232B9881|nr:M23/M56 family metallopeptidase [Aquimarina algiphila]